MTRRMQHYTQPEWYPWVLVAGLGALLILTGIALQVAQLTASIRSRARRREPTGDPWDGRTLEWATSSPPPAYNFAVLPYVENEQPYWGMKLQARENMRLSAEPNYEPIEVPRNTPTGFITAFFAVLTGFSLVLAWRDVSEETIPAEEVARADRANRAKRLEALQAAGRLQPLQQESAA
jgi:cytochrome o ubiquinol oxidase subunit I